MANQVFANGMEIACKAGAGKVIAAFPDVCMTPPESPATPPGVPVPYPNTAMASDTTDGSKSVTISDKEVMLKNKSCFKTSTGDEAGCAAKKGLISSKNKGKVYFIKWSMDVKIEGENVDRNFDMTTNNHGSPTANEALPWLFIDSMDAPPAGHPCRREIKEMQQACGKRKTRKQKSVSPTTGKIRTKTIRVGCSDECKKKMGCILVPKRKDKTHCCSPDNTGHHLIEDHWVRPNEVPMKGFLRAAVKHAKSALAKGLRRKADASQELYDGAPTVCSNASRYYKKHGVGHGISGVVENSLIGKKDFNYGKGKKIAVRAQKEMYPKSNCKKRCIESQLDAFYGNDPRKKLNNSDRRQGMKVRQRKKSTRILKEKQIPGIPI